MKKILLFILLSVQQALAQNPQILKDINTVAAGIPNVGKQVVVGSLLYFVKEPSEIWKTDGTAAGTVLVKHIIAANGDADIDNLTNVSGTIFFSATDGIVGKELWKTDGTAVGTVMVKDIQAGSLDSDPTEFVAYSGQLVFAATTAANGIELWKSDGTSVGTVLIKDIQSGTDNSYPQGFRVVQSILYFSAYTAANGTELWKTDGTTGGTVLVKDIRSGTASSYPNYLINVSSFTISNGVLYFTADNGISGIELWKSDGTTAGTVQVLDICSGSKGSEPKSLTNVDGTLYFSADNYTSPNSYENRELWKSNSAGTAMIKDINGIATQSSFLDYTTFRVVNTTLYFSAEDAVNGVELWKSSGTSAGTVLVKDINAGSSGSYPSSLFSIGSTLYFTADDGTNGGELWKSNGSSAGTVLVKDINVGSGSYSPENLINLSGSLIFGAVDVPNGTVREFWKSDGTTNGTTKISLSGSTVGASPSQPLTIGNTLYFSANDGINGIELWKTDGSAIGTTMVKDINLGGDSSPENLININGILFFTANDGSRGIELWKSDGTAEGTVMVKDIFTGTNQSSSPIFFCNVNGVLFFAAYHPTYGYELWKSDGTTPGTVMVKDIDEGTNPSIFYGSNLTNVNGTLFFFAKTNTQTAITLYTSDGTNSGTVAFQGIGPNTISISSTTVFNNAFFFSYENVNVFDHRLWSSASLPYAIYSTSPIDNNPYDLTDVNGVLFFSAKNAANGQELWKTDGTQAGSVMVKDINSSGSSSPYRLSNVNGILYFRANDGTNGTELWKSNGTLAGTVMVKDIKLGSANSDIKNITDINGTAFFFASDGFHGIELWKSDGTTIGTVIVADINADNNNGIVLDIYGNAVNPIKLSNSIFFVANDGVHGTELWKYTTCPQGFAATPAGTINTNLFAAETIITLDGSPNIIPPNANVTYQAGKYIQLNNGFQTQTNVVFKAQVGGCN